MSPQARDRETVEREPLWHFKLILMKHQVFFSLLTWLVCIKLLAQPWKLAHVLRNWLPPSLASLKLQHFSLLFLWEVKKSLWWNLILFFRACWAYTVSSYPYSLRCEDKKKTGANWRALLTVFLKMTCNEVAQFLSGSFCSDNRTAGSWEMKT